MLSTATTRMVPLVCADGSKRGERIIGQNSLEAQKEHAPFAGISVCVHSGRSTRIGLAQPHLCTGNDANLTSYIL